MGGMKRPMKTALIIIALALLACLVVLSIMFVSRPDEPTSASVPDTSRQGPSFEVHVMKPRRARFLFGILPNNLEAKLLGGGAGELRFDHTSPGAEIGSVGHDRLELRAGGWDLLIETDGKGGIAPGTRLLFPLERADRPRRLRCRPADRATGYLRTTRAGSGKLDGRFLVELATCEDAVTGEVLEWPPAPLTVRGSFAGLPPGRH